LQTGEVPEIEEKQFIAPAQPTEKPSSREDVISA
jgi:hypothetical protein